MKKIVCTLSIIINFAFASEYTNVTYWTNLNKRYALGRTQLHLAVINNQYTIAKQLLARGIDKNICDNYGKTAYDYANKLNLPKIKFILSKKR